MGGLDVGVLSAIAEVLARDETRALEDCERRHAELIRRRNPRSGDCGDDFPLRHPPAFGWLVLGRGGGGGGGNGNGNGEGWRPRYYRHLFMHGASSATVEEVHGIGLAYAATVAWSSAYLARQTCLSPGWHYTHARAPTALDLHYALASYHHHASAAATFGDAAFGGAVFGDAVRLAFEAADAAHGAWRRIAAIRDDGGGEARWQLLHVLPPQSRELMPGASDDSIVALLARHAYAYPTEFRVCTYLHERTHECAPILAALDISS